MHVILERWRLAIPREDWADQPILAYRDPDTKTCYACFDDGVRNIDATLAPRDVRDAGGLVGNGYVWCGYERFPLECMPA